MAGLLYGVATEGYAQSLVFDHLDVENGLSQRSVLSIAQDGKGFIWLATRNGLNRYDGHAFRIFKNIPGQGGSLCNNYVYTLFCDSHHQLWVGTNLGLDRYDAVNDSFVHIQPAAAIRLPSRSISSFAEDRAGNLWVGTSNGLGWIGHSGSPPPPLFDGVDIRTVYEDRRGDIWLGTAVGITRLTLRQGHWQLQSFTHTSEPGSLSNDYTSTFAEDLQGQLWIGTRSGLDLYHPESNTFTVSHPLMAIRKIIRDKKGKLWIGALEGLTVLDPLTGKDTSYNEDPENRKGLSHNSIYSLFQDAGASIWIGTYFGGANIVNSYSTPFTIYQNSKFHSSISNNVISGMAEDESHLLYIGTEGGGLNSFDRLTGLFTAYKYRAGDVTSLGSNLVKIVYRDRSGKIWVGTHDGGLQQLDAARRQFIRYPASETSSDQPESEIDVLLEDRRGRLWIGRQTGLQLLAGKEVTDPGQPMSGILGKKAIHALLEDARGNLWVGTTNGLFAFTADGLPLPGPPEASGLTNTYINSLWEDAGHRLWVGKYYGGLAVYDPATPKTVTYTEKDGLANNNVLGVLEDGKGYLWISTDNGLCRMDTSKRQFFTYTASDGLAANGFNYNSYFRDRNGKLYFGGYNGFTTFYPDSIETNNYVAPVVFTGLRLFNIPVEIHAKDGLLNKDISQMEGITLHYGQNVFTLEFALLNYTKPDKNKYRYRLGGFDKQWYEVNAFSATYTNLPAGDYTFEVKGANNDGLWSAPAILHIRVLPPFWATWWAYSIYVLLIAVVVFFITRFFFLRALLKRDSELHQVKLNFFTNVSHEIRTHLTLISGPVEKMLGDQNGEPFFQQQLQYVRGSADRLLRLVEELMDFRKAETNHLKLNPTRQDIVEFVRSIYQSFEELAQSRRIALEFAADSPVIELPFDKEQMEKVFYNLLTNAFKFTPNGGNIRVEIDQNSDAVEVRIIDNGKGIAPGNVKKLFVNFFQVDDHNAQNTGYGIGLALSKSIVKWHKGDLTVESTVGVGSTFTITLPYATPLDSL